MSAAWLPPLLVSAVVTGVVTAASYLLPDSWAVNAVAFCFLGATAVLVLRRDTSTIREHGLSLGGVLEPEPLSLARVSRAVLVALAWSFLAALVIFPCFWIGFREWWDVSRFRPARLTPFLDDALGQLLLVALPEEAFYRGYLQTELERGFKKTVRVLGADVGWGLLASSAIFAVGHLLTELDAGRLAVFFPSLVFGWLRARTGGIGASLVFHALCNLFASYLLHSYGLVR